MRSVMPRGRATSEPQRLTIVLAPWCPHCVPLSVRHGRRFAHRLRVPLRVLDIDKRAQEKVADRLVREYGDASPDYLIPQVFLEFEDGSYKHLLTGYPEGVVFTKKAVENLTKSDLLGPKT